MKIVHIIPGSGGGFYCGNCLRDSKLIQSMRNQNVDSIVLPMYLPLFDHNRKDLKVPVFYGAVSIYLKQLFPIFRKAPKWLDRFFNSKPVLNLAAKMANSTRATGLEEMTISMLMGEEGKQNEELEKMVSWLENNYKADIIHISNALLIGLAKKLKTRLNVPIVCSLQDEDVWIDVMSEENRKKVWNLISEKAEHVDRFISVSDYYKTFMLKKLKIESDKISTLHLGINPDDYEFNNSVDKPKNIGFLSRLCKDNGLDILVDAFIILKLKMENRQTKLVLSGGHTADDNKFIKKQKDKIKKAGLIKSLIIIDDFDGAKRKEFFNNITVLSVPVINGEAFGIYLTEAMASGVPVVQPNLGAFPEIIDISKGGIVYNNNTPENLADALNKILNDNEKLSELSSNARIGVEKKFNVKNISKQMIDRYVCEMN